MKNLIKLKPIHHRGMSCIAIFFEVAEVDYIPMKARLKKLGCRFTRTYQGWYVSRERSSVTELFEGLKEFGYIDYSAFKSKAEYVPEVAPRNTVELPERHRAAFEQYSELLDARGYAENTKRTYLNMVKIFLKWFETEEIAALSNEDVNRFFSQCLVAQRYSSSSQRQMVSALKLFFLKQHHRQLDVEAMEYPRKHRPLPRVLSPQEVAAIISRLENMKHRCMVALQYGCGLRVNELLNLRVVDVDGDAALLFIRKAKGNRDRRVKLSESLLGLLRKYYGVYRPRLFLFEGQGGGPYSANSVNAVLKRAAQQAGIQKKVSSHMLRHSYATHLLNQGVDLRLIQELLGHKSSRTTEIYTHVSSQMIESVPSPYDHLDFDEAPEINTTKSSDNPRFL